MELLRLLVIAGSNSDLRRLLFSKFSLLLSFLEVDVAGTPPPSRQATAPATASAVDSDRLGHDGSSGVGGRRLYFASPVARLMGVVVGGDNALVTSVSDEHLTQLAMAATRSRYLPRATRTNVRQETCICTYAWGVP